MPGYYREEGTYPLQRLEDNDTSWMFPVTYEIRPTREEKIAAKKAARKAAKPRRIKFK